MILSNSRPELRQCVVFAVCHGRIASGNHCAQRGGLSKIQRNVVKHGVYAGGGAEPPRVRELHPDALHPAGAQGLHRAIVREPPREPHLVPAPVLPEARAGKCRVLASATVMQLNVAPGGACGVSGCGGCIIASGGW